MTLNDPRSYLIPSPLSAGGTCKYDITPMIMLCGKREIILGGPDFIRTSL